MRADLINRRDCECPEDHSITKLGHCRTCPYVSLHVDQGIDPVRQFKRSASIAAARERLPKLMTLFVCGGRSDAHEDGTAHDFDWATYADECESFGVCYCGKSNAYDPMADPY